GRIRIRNNAVDVRVRHGEGPRADSRSVAGHGDLDAVGEAGDLGVVVELARRGLEAGLEELDDVIFQEIRGDDINVLAVAVRRGRGIRVLEVAAGAQGDGGRVALGGVDPLVVDGDRQRGGVSLRGVALISI